MKATTRIQAMEVITTFILSVSILSVSLLALGRFSVLWALLPAGLLTIVAGLFSFRSWDRKLSFTLFIPCVGFFVVLLVAVIFRLSPYSWIAGAQDQGVYVNMSKHFQRTGQLFLTDEVRESLPSELKDIYDTTNYGVNVRVEGKKEGSFLPGLYIKDLDTSQHVFQFYHLHPLWMALFGEVLGDDNRTYSLVFFSLISILAFYLLAFELTGSRLLAWIAGGLLALNPLHAFFSKFPATEVVALAFSLLSFYHLLKYYNRAKAGEHYLPFLILSALSMGCMFFTRISGFMYIPFFYLLLLVVEVYGADKRLKTYLRTYVFSVFFLYGLSVLYGLTYSYPYATEIYHKSFRRALGGDWQQRLALVVAALSFIYPLVIYFTRSKFSGGMKKGLISLQQYIPYVFLVFFILGAYKVYQLGFTDALINSSLYGVRWGAAGTGAKALLYWSPVVLVEYLSPFISILFVYTLIVTRKTLNVERTLLLLFVLSFFAYICVLQWFIPYQYYYARYLLSEALPYTLLFTVTGIAILPNRKKVAYSLVVCAAIYMLAFSATQFRGKDMGGLKESLDELAETVTEDDILLVGQRWVYSTLTSELKTPLTFYYNFNVISTDSKSSEPFIGYFCGQDRPYIYYFSRGEQPGLGRPLKVLNISAEIFEHTPYIPTQIVKGSVKHHLYKISCPKWLRSRAALGR